MPRKFQPLSFAAPTQYRAWLETQAATEDRSISAIIRRLIDAEIERRGEAPIKGTEPGFSYARGRYQATSYDCPPCPRCQGTGTKPYGDNYYCAGGCAAVFDADGKVIK